MMAPLSPQEQLAIIRAAHGTSTKRRGPDPANDICSITRLPNEGLDQIFSYITSKHDLAQLCKVNKRFFESAVPLLYKAINITLKDIVDPKLTQMFTLENKGLHHIREVAVYSSPRVVNRPRAMQWLYVLINQIPKNNLSRLGVKTSHPLPPRVLRLLWARQQSLHCIEIHTHRDGFEASLGELARLEFDKLGEVRLVPTVPETALLGSEILQCGMIKALEVDCRFWNEDDAHMVQDDDSQGQHVEDKLTACLFDHVDRVKRGMMPQWNTLTRLCLKDVNVTLCKDTWFCYLDPCHLQQLRLEHCKGADIFMLRLGSQTAAPALTSLAVVHDPGMQSDRTIDAVEDLMKAHRDKLCNLELCLRNATRHLAPWALRNHGGSLKTVLLDISGMEQLNPANNGWGALPPAPAELIIYDYRDFETIINNCKTLTELGIALPTHDLEYDKVSSPECAFFVDYIDKMASTLSLATLNILNWPSQYTGGQSRAYYLSKNRQLARVASDIFRRHRLYDPITKKFGRTERQACLEVIAFGTRKQEVTFPAPACFVQSQVRIIGKTLVEATAVNLKYLRNQSLDIKILDHEKRNFYEHSRTTDLGGGQDGWNDDDYGEEEEHDDDD